MEQVICESCNQNPAGVKCKCSRQHFCDTCYDSHINHYLDYTHIPEVISSTLTWKYQFPLALLISKKDQITQKKEQYINSFILKSIKQLSDFKNLLLKKDSETLSTFLKLFNSSEVTDKELGQFNSYLEGIDESYKLIETSQLDLKLSELKDGLFKELKDLSEYNYCNLCFKKNEELASLDCSHKLCSECYVKILGNQTNNLYVYNEIEVPNPTFCPINECKIDITTENMMKNLPDYEKYKDGAEKRYVITCKECGKQGKKNEFIVNCFDLCNECNIKNLRNKQKVCLNCEGQFSEKEIEVLSNLTLECEGCLNHKKMISEFPKFVCKHKLCLSCVEDCKEKVCYFGCNFNLTDSDYNSLFSVKCNRCPTQVLKSSAYWVSKDCNCPICEDCQFNISREFCVECNIPLSETAILILENEARKQCPVCSNFYCMDKLCSMINCTHEMCTNCLTLNFEYLAGDFSLIGKIDKCIVCDELIPEYQLEKLLSPKIYEKYSTYTLRSSGVPLVDCPKCKVSFSPGFQRKVVCFKRKCNYIFCKTCLEEYHEDGDCEEAFLEQKIKEMENMEGGVTQCPRCRFPYLKDPKNCEHADCIKEGCMTSFCFVCACLRSPTMAHGNHYHRPECRFWDDYDGRDDKIEPKCSECQRLGKLCSKPERLRKPRLVAKDEAI